MAVAAGTPVFWIVLNVVVALALLAVGLKTMFRATLWPKLAKTYRFEGDLPERLVSAGTVTINGMLIRNCGVQVSMSEAGLFLCGPRAVGLWPPLLIPWSDIEPDDLDGDLFHLGHDRVPFQVRTGLSSRMREHIAASSGTTVTVSEGSGPDRCPFCHDLLETGPVGACVHCGTQHHAECIHDHGGCSVPACGGAPREKEPPPSLKA